VLGGGQASWQHEQRGWSCLQHYSIIAAQHLELHYCVKHLSGHWICTERQPESFAAFIHAAAGTSQQIRAASVEAPAAPPPLPPPLPVEPRSSAPPEASATTLHAPDGACSALQTCCLDGCLASWNTQIHNAFQSATQSHVCMMWLTTVDGAFGLATKPWPGLLYAATQAHNMQCDIAPARLSEIFLLMALSSEVMQCCAGAHLSPRALVYMDIHTAEETAGAAPGQLQGGTALLLLQFRMCAQGQCCCPCSMLGCSKQRHVLAPQHGNATSAFAVFFSLDRLPPFSQQAIVRRSTLAAVKYICSNCAAASADGGTARVHHTPRAALAHQLSRLDAAADVAIAGATAPAFVVSCCQDGLRGRLCS
jgi:hypothetical protein